MSLFGSDNQEVRRETMRQHDVIHIAIFITSCSLITQTVGPIFEEDQEKHHTQPTKKKHYKNCVLTVLSYVPLFVGLLYIWTAWDPVLLQWSYQESEDHRMISILLKLEAGKMYSNIC